MNVFLDKSAFFLSFSNFSFTFLAAFSSRFLKGDFKPDFYSIVGVSCSAFFIGEELYLEFYNLVFSDFLDIKVFFFSFLWKIGAAFNVFTGEVALTLLG